MVVIHEGWIHGVVGTGCMGQPVNQWQHVKGWTTELVVG